MMTIVLSPEEIERRFTYYAPDEATRALHEEWRRHEREFAELLNAVPAFRVGDAFGHHPGQSFGSRELSLAFTALEELTFWVHAHIARNLHPR